MKIPYSFVSFDDRNPARGRWDGGWIEQILAGDVWLPPGGLEFTEIDAFDGSGGGRVIVAPMGSYVENECEVRVAKMLSNYLRGLEWSVLIATSDECALFPWKLVDLPESCKLWIQCPQPEKPYPIGARFIPFGPQTPPQKRSEMLVRVVSDRPYDVSFQGQINHERREEMWQALEELDANTHETHVYIRNTGGFAQGVERSDYLYDLWLTWIAPAPSGPCTQDSFRLYEALDAGCIPIVDSHRPDFKGRNYWQMVGFEPMRVDGWESIDVLVEMYLQRRHFHAARASAGWQQYKRHVVTQLQDDCGRLSGDTPSDRVTVIIPTSPVPSNPDLSMIQTTIASVRERLPHAEILVTCDGVRPEQEHRRAAYEIFCHELAMWCNTEHNVCLWVYDEHLHQSGMAYRILDEAATPYILYVEADCPLEGEIPFDDVLGAMQAFGLNSMRFYHDVALTEGSEHLFLHHVDTAYVPFVETIQFSARPHVARTDWYREILATHFGPESRSFIEDVMHGVTQFGLKTDKEGLFTHPKQVSEAWGRWRMAVYAPEGSWKRSGHLDGRGDDPKYPVFIADDPNRPEGGLRPGVHEV